MRSKTLTVYKFSELSDTAKDKAKQDHAAACGYCWADDAMASIKALAAHFDGEMSNWSVDWFACSHSSAEFAMPEMDKKEIAARLKQLGTYNRKTLRGNGDCKLTGFCMDEAAIDGFRMAFKAGETSLVALMQAAFDSWLKEAQSDCEFQFSDESFGDNCEANSYEFYEDGELA